MSMVMDKDNLEKASLVAKEVMATWYLPPFITALVGHIPDLVEEVLRLSSKNTELLGHLTNVNTTNKGLKSHIYALDERRDELTKQLAEAKEASDARVQPLIAKIDELRKELIKKCEKQVDLGKDIRAMQGKLADQAERNRQLKEELQKAKNFKIDGRVDHFSQFNNLIGLGLEVTKNSLKNAASPSDVGRAMENLRTMSREVEVWAEFLKDPAVFAIVQKQLDPPNRKTTHLVKDCGHYVCNSCGTEYSEELPYVFVLREGASMDPGKVMFCPDCGAEFIYDEEDDDECT